MLKSLAHYPKPTAVEPCEADYVKHLELLHETAGIPADVKPYTVTTLLPTPEGAPPYYQLFAMPFESPEALQATMASAAMQEVGADAARISTGGAPVFLI